MLIYAWRHVHETTHLFSVHTEKRPCDIVDIFIIKKTSILFFTIKGNKPQTNYIALILFKMNNKNLISVSDITQTCHFHAPYKEL